MELKYISCIKLYSINRLTLFLIIFFLPQLSAFHLVYIYCTSPVCSFVTTTLIGRHLQLPSKTTTSSKSYYSATPAHPYGSSLPQAREATATDHIAKHTRHTRQDVCCYLLHLLSRISLIYPLCFCKFYSVQFYFVVQIVAVSEGFLLKNLYALIIITNV